MGAIASRLNIDSLHPSGRRSQQDEIFYSYSLNKNYFSNYFLMGGERFEVNDPDYLFGDNCDLNFLSCSKPYSLPYKKAQQNLLSNLSAKQKSNNKTSSRVNVSLASPLNIITGRHRQESQCQKQDAQTQTLSNLSKDLTHGPEPSQPLVMLINIRKETLRLVRITNTLNTDSDLNSLSNNNISPIQTSSMVKSDIGQRSQDSTVNGTARVSPMKINAKQSVRNGNRHSTNSSNTTTTATVHMVDNDSTGNPRITPSTRGGDEKGGRRDSDTISNASLPRASAVSSAADTEESSSSASSKSGYTSVKDMPPSSGSDDDDNFEDALNDTTTLSNSSKDDGDEEESERAQQQKSLLRNAGSNNEAADANIDIESRLSDHDDNSDPDLSSVRIANNLKSNARICGRVIYTKRGKRHRKDSSTEGRRVSPIKEKNLPSHNQHLVDRVYNIEFYFDCEVDCSIRVFYFCTREVNSNGVTYKPQHATYKSKTYIYKKGLNQKFDQPEHTFQPYLFDEDLLIYKPLDLEGNYNSGAVFPIVIHCIALQGPLPRQSQSLIATVEKSQLDESYSIKPLKQLIFVDGVQYILQDIYGIENKQFPTHNTKSNLRKQLTKNKDKRKTLDLRSRSSVISIESNEAQRQQHFSDTASIASGLILEGELLHDNDEENNEDDEDKREKSMDPNGSLASVGTTNQRFKSISTDNNSFECVICMSEERDTMLLPCRHLCLCSSCAQSLRYQANSCPICRCPFKAALNLRVTPFNSKDRRILKNRA